MSEERITALEEEIAHLRRLNEELSSEIHAQWKRLDTLDGTLRKLESRQAEVEGHLEEADPNQKPPHW